MVTCPRCGRTAGDEVVCGSCGMSLARTQALMDDLVSEDDDGAQPTGGPVWRAVALAGLVCVLAAAGAVIALNSGGAHRNADLPLAITPTAADTMLDLQTPDAPRLSFDTIGSTRTAAATSSTSRTRSASRSPSTSRGASASRSRTARTASAAQTTSHAPPSRSSSASTPPTPRTSTATSRTIPPSTPASTPPRPTPTVQAARGSPNTLCGRHCYPIVVTLADFAAGSHQVVCWSTNLGQFGSYSTTSTTSAQCTDRRPHDSIRVEVDGVYWSNTVTW